MTTLRNSVQLIGRLGTDPKTKKFGKNSSITRFSLATSDSYTNKEGERVTDTQWHNVVLRNGLAGVAEKYLQKGHEVAVSGKLINRSWDDDAGTKHYITEIEVTDLVLLEKKAKTA
ncbi:MAG: single-stranded DNA-binding protein [Bacteroidetes bacterium]|nr:single-stranded DNA-binding protein [Bacteroidota bacterium]